MSAKKQALAAVRQMPDDRSWQDRAEHARVMAAIKETPAIINRGAGIPQDETKRGVRSWLQK